MNARTIAIAKERQLDWLLGEVLGAAATRTRAPAHGTSRWLVAAFATLALGAALGTALLRDDAGTQPIQEPAGIEWTECHGTAALAAIAAEVTALKCFDFDDAACAQLARFTKLERLDLSGSDVNEKGYSVPPQVKDPGVRELAALTNLRWLCLARCHDMKGEGLQALEALPQLEHLDLTYSGVESPAIERLPRLPGLRSLVLSSCMNFHGRSLAAIATIPGLRRLELQACTTLSAKDVLHLVNLKELRHLDLRDCQGSFRGQTDGGNATFVDTDNDGIPDKRVEPPPPPVQDGIGITDDVVVALAALPLHTLLLGGSESLTDAIGPALAKMTTLRALDLSDLPRITDALLATVPGALTSLALDQNRQFGPAELARLPRLTTLTELGLSGVRVDGATLDTLLGDKQLTALRLGGSTGHGKDRNVTLDSGLRAADAAILAKQKQLEALDLSYAQWLDAGAMQQIATLPKLELLDLSGASIGQADQLAPLAKVATLRRLELDWCQHLDDGELTALAGAHLTELDLYRTNLKDEHIRAAAKAWPGCLITMPKDARRWRAP